MPFTPILPTEYYTDRQDLNDALVAIIDAFISSTNYAVIRKRYSEMPANLAGEHPMVVLGDIREELQYTAQLIRFVFTGSIWYVDWLNDREAYNTRVNTFADMFRSLFAVNRSAVNPNGVLSETGFDEGIELRQGTLIFGTPQLHFTYVVMRGDPGGNPA